MCFLGFASSIVALFGIRRYGSEGIAGKSLAGFVICLLVGVLFGTMRLIEIPNLLVEIAWQPPAQLAQQIAGADRVIVLQQGNNPVFVNGEDTQKIIVAVSSARRDAGAYSCAFTRKIEFCKGTNSLATVGWCGHLILADEGQFSDNSGVLNTLYHELFMR
jgi:hypothetical protein